MTKDYGDGYGDFSFSAPCDEENEKKARNDRRAAQMARPGERDRVNKRRRELAALRRQQEST